MKYFLPVATVVLALSGCAPEAEPPPPAPAFAPSNSKPPPAVKKEPVKKEPLTKPTPKLAAKQTAPRTVDDFNLPLVIRIDVPDAPPEVTKPSPPIPEEAKNSGDS